MFRSLRQSAPRPQRGKRGLSVCVSRVQTAAADAPDPCSGAVCGPPGTFVLSHPPPPPEERRSGLLNPELLHEETGQEPALQGTSGRDAETEARVGEQCREQRRRREEVQRRNPKSLPRLSSV